MKGHFPIDKFSSLRTPFYYYDTALLRETLRAIVSETARHEGFCVHYAVKANANPKLMNAICQAGLGADCVSGGEIQASVDAGFQPSKIVFAGDVVCHVLWPPAEGAAAMAVSESGRTNNQSVVCKVSFGSFSVLFTGDAQREAEEQLLRQGRRNDLKATVLKAGHHGSRTSSSPAFLEAVRPEAAVISCGAGNSYGFPHAAVLTALKKQRADVYRTDRDGTISVVSDGQGYTITKER